MNPPARILIINGSARKRGETAAVIRQVVALLDAGGLTFDWLDLYAYDLRPCVGCSACVGRGVPCPLDNSSSLLERIASYDGLILASPVYMGNVTGQLKILIDKTSWWFHRPQLVGKPALVVSTTGGSRLGHVLRYLEYVAIEWGMQPAGRIGRSASRRAPVQPREVLKFARLLQQDRACYRPGLAEVVSFEVKRALRRYQVIDGPYWDAQGWSRRPFYYPCRLSPVHRLVGRGMRILLKAVLRDPPA